jgi:hypothetical protein
MAKHVDRIDQSEDSCFGNRLFNVATNCLRWGYRDVGRERKYNEKPGTDMRQLAKYVWVARVEQRSSKGFPFKTNWNYYDY